jgi:hypothetical protein
MTDLFKLIFGILASRFKARATLEAENLVLRQQVNVLRRRTPKRPHLNNTDRFLFVWLYRWFPSVLEVVAGNHHSLAPCWCDGRESIWKIIEQPEPWDRLSTLAVSNKRSMHGRPRYAPNISIPRKRCVLGSPLWHLNERMWADGSRSTRRRPIDHAGNGGFPWQEIRCSRCKTTRDVDLAAMKHPPTTFVHDLASRLRRRKCTKAGRCY